VRVPHSGLGQPARAEFGAPGLTMRSRMLRSVTRAALMVLADPTRRLSAVAVYQLDVAVALDPVGFARPA